MTIEHSGRSVGSLVGHTQRVRASAATVIAASLFLAACSNESVTRVGEPTRNLVGDWLPAEVPSVRFTRNFESDSRPISFTAGRWKAYDGCNENGGDYTVDTDGDFRSLGNPVPAIWCTNQIPYDVLLNESTEVSFESDGTAVFRAENDELLLSLVPTTFHSDTSTPQRPKASPSK